MKAKRKERRVRGIVACVEAWAGTSLFFLRTWHWVARGHNGEILASSETYSNQSACEQTAKQVAAQLECKYVVRYK